MNRFMWLGVAAFLCGANSTLAYGQDSVLAELYGQGVHSYFSGDYSNAKELLTNAIAQGSKDPRVFYFRGLTYHRIGRATDGDADLKLGAALEATGTERIYPVSDSLQRVQGRMRMQIEKQRQQARLANRLKHNQAEQARYQQMERSDRTATPNRAPATGAAVAPAAPVTPDKTDPFVDDMEAKPAPAPAKPPAVATEPKPEANDPFATTRPGTATPAATEKPAEAAGADPFGTPATPPAKDASDPFSTEKPVEALPAEAPPAEKPAEKPSADPFG